MRRVTKVQGGRMRCADLKPSPNWVSIILGGVKSALQLFGLRIDATFTAANHADLLRLLVIVHEDDWNDPHCQTTSLEAR